MRKSAYKQKTKLLITLEKEDKDKLQRAVAPNKSMTTMIQEAVKMYIIQNGLR